MSDPLDPDATGTDHPPPPLIPAGESFAPGALLTGRYRIVAAPRQVLRGPLRNRPADCIWSAARTSDPPVLESQR
jgi:hypothetical protein